MEQIFHLILVQQKHDKFEIVRRWSVAAGLVCSL